MKKIYFAPETNVQKVEVSQMICVSAEIDDNKQVTDIEDVGAREYKGNSIWDDEF